MAAAGDALNCTEQHWQQLLTLAITTLMHQIQVTPSLSLSFSSSKSVNTVKRYERVVSLLLCVVAFCLLLASLPLLLSPLPVFYTLCVLCVEAAAVCTLSQRRALHPRRSLNARSLRPRSSRQQSKPYVRRPKRESSEPPGPPGQDS